MSSRTKAARKQPPAPQAENAAAAAAELPSDPAPSASSPSAAKKSKAGAASGEGSAPAASASASQALPQSAMPRAPPPPAGARGFRALSWNVAGLRALLRDDSSSSSSSSSAEASASASSGKIDSAAVLRRLVDAEQPDAFCLLEHKLQTQHVPECEAALRALLPAEYGAYYWAVSSGDKKGYSGVVVIAKGAVHSEVDGQPSANPAAAGAASATPKGEAAAKTKSIASFFAPAAAAATGSDKGSSTTESATTTASASATAASSSSSSSSSSSVQPQPAWGGAGAPLRVSYGLGAQASHRGEGRAVTLTFAAFHITFCYVPNAGEGLKRLDFRLNEWERDMIAHVQWLRAGSACPQLQSGLPVVIGGDLNCAHDDADMYNFGAKHLLKQAGCTPDERQAFTHLLDTAALVDSFRSVHGADTHGCFTYWSQRAGNRPLNRGLRLDYFLVSRELASSGESAAAAAAVSLRDSYISDLTVGVSDHAPVVVDLTLA